MLTALGLQRLRRLGALAGRPCDGRRWFFGCAAGFMTLRFAGAPPVLRLLRITGTSPEGVQGRLHAATGPRTSLVFALQLIPTARILAPLLAVLPRTRVTHFLLASFLGITTWNTVFISWAMLRQEQSKPSI